MKTLLRALACLLLAGIIGAGVWIGVASNGFRDFSSFGSKKEQVQTDPPEEEEPKHEDSGVTDENGLELVSARRYEMPRQMIFSLATVQSVSASEGVKIRATITPDDATNKLVDFTFEFKDPDSEWATGKEASTYISITPDDDGSPDATVKCLAPFGEQIVITATSRGMTEDEQHVKGTCNVDYLQKVETANVSIGDVPVNFTAGKTNITLCVGKEKSGQGGVVSSAFTLASTYTIPATYEKKVEMHCYFAINGNSDEREYVGYNDKALKWFTYSSFVSGGSYEEEYIYNDVTGMSFYFDRRLFSEYEFKIAEGTEQKETLLSTMKAAQIAEFLRTNNCVGKILWTVKYTLTSEKKTYTYESDLILSEIDETVNVADLELGGDIIF